MKWEIKQINLKGIWHLGRETFNHLFHDSEVQTAAFAIFFRKISKYTQVKAFRECNLPAKAREGEMREFIVELQSVCSLSQALSALRCGVSLEKGEILRIRERQNIHVSSKIIFRVIWLSPSCSLYGFVYLL